VLFIIKLLKMFIKCLCSIKKSVDNGNKKETKLKGNFNNYFLLFWWLTKMK